MFFSPIDSAFTRPIRALHIMTFFTVVTHIIGGGGAHTRHVCTHTHTAHRHTGSTHTHTDIHTEIVRIFTFKHTLKIHFKINDCEMLKMYVHLHTLHMTHKHTHTHTHARARTHARALTHTHTQTHTHTHRHAHAHRHTHRNCSYFYIQTHVIHSSSCT